MRRCRPDLKRARSLACPGRGESAVSRATGLGEPACARACIQSYDYSLTPALSGIWDAVQEIKKIGKRSLEIDF
jgi:hypothetical protein